MRSLHGPRALERPVERAGRILLLAFAVALAGMSIASSVSYSSVVVAQATVSVTPLYQVTWSSVDAEGVLRSDGAVAVIATLTVDNPSSRILRFRLVAYGGWIEDGPAEAGLNESRRVADGIIAGATGTRYFYLAISDSKEIQPFEVPALGNRSISLTYVLNRTGNPVGFDAVRNITAYAAATRGDGSAMPWNHWVRVQLTIDGVPVASSPSAGSHLQVLGTIDREEGINLAR